MARPVKKGLQYFPLDVDTFVSDKFKLIHAEFGNNGVLVVLHLYCKIYRENGYYYKWNNDACLLLAAGVGLMPSFVNEVLNACFRRGLLDRNIFQLHNVITSHGIQARYFEIAKKSKLSNLNLQHQFILLSDAEKEQFKSIFTTPANTKNSEHKSGINDHKLRINPQSSGINPLNENENKSKNTTTITHDPSFDDMSPNSANSNFINFEKQMLSASWIEQVCASQGFNADQFLTYLRQYIELKKLSGEASVYAIYQHKRFVISDFLNRSASKAVPSNPHSSQTSTRSTQSAKSVKESAIEHNKRIFNKFKENGNNTFNN